MRPNALPQVVGIALVQHAPLMIAMLFRYRCRRALLAVAVTAGLGVAWSVLFALVAVSYWSEPVSSEDFGWPLTDIILASFPCFMISIMLGAAWVAVTSERGQSMAGSAR